MELKCELTAKNMARLRDERSSRLVGDATQDKPEFPMSRPYIAERRLAQRSRAEPATRARTTRCAAPTAPPLAARRGGDLGVRNDLRREVQGSRERGNVDVVFLF